MRRARHADEGGEGHPWASSLEHNPQVVLLDLNLPGMDGFELCRRLRADPDTATLPVIVLAAHTAIIDELERDLAGIAPAISLPTVAGLEPEPALGA